MERRHCVRIAYHLFDFPAARNYEKRITKKYGIPHSPWNSHLYLRHPRFEFELGGRLHWVALGGASCVLWDRRVYFGIAFARCRMEFLFRAHRRHDRGGGGRFSFWLSALQGQWRLLRNRLALSRPHLIQCFFL